MSNITDVVVSIHVSSSNPILPIIKVEEVITGGIGTFAETIFGGQVNIRINLESGRELKKLHEGEFVYVRGMQNGSPFVINGAFTVTKADKPWGFSRTSGSTG